MASLDFVFDLLEQLRDQNIEYLLVTVQRNKTGKKVDLFYNCDALETIEGFVKGTEKAYTDLGKIIDKEAKKMKAEKKKKKQ